MPRGGNFEDYDLTNSKLVGSEFRTITFENGTLTNIDAKGAIFDLCNFKGADLTSVALALGAEKPVGHLVLEAPFTSAADVAARYLWFLPVRLLMKDQFRSDLRVGKVMVPVLVVHGEDDAIVPVTLGERLYGLIRAPKRFVRVAGAGHNDLGAQAVAAAKQFVAEE